MKKIYVINGEAGSGKDTFVELCAEVLGEGKVVNVSTVDPVKQMAKIAGWDGIKTPESRRFLSDLKDMCEKTFETSYVYVKRQIEEFQASEDAELMFIHSREPEQIAKFCKDFGAKSLLIVRNNYGTDPSNHADANVYDYDYDLKVINPGDTLEAYKLKAACFVECEFREAVEY